MLCFEAKQAESNNNHPYREFSVLVGQAIWAFPLVLEARERVTAKPDLLGRQLRPRRRVGIDVEGIEGGSVGKSPGGGGPRLRGPGRSARESGGGPHQQATEAASATRTSAGAGSQNEDAPEAGSRLRWW